MLSRGASSFFLVYLLYTPPRTPLMRFLFVVVGEEGLEPTVQIGTDLQSARLPITDYSPNYERKIVRLSKYIFFI